MDDFSNSGFADGSAGCLNNGKDCNCPQGYTNPCGCCREAYLLVIDGQANSDVIESLDEQIKKCPLCHRHFSEYLKFKCTVVEKLTNCRKTIPTDVLTAIAGTVMVG